MFASHQPIIGRYARQGSKEFSHVMLAAILSARQPFERVREEFSEVMGGNFKPLFAWKRQAWETAQERSAAILAECEAIVAKRKPSVARDAALLRVITSCHGLGPVKGGFVAQLAFGAVGCLDSRNEAAFGIDPGLLRSRKELTAASMAERLKRYAHQCRRLGGCEHLWDYWCSSFAVTSPSLKSPWEVSAEHCRIFGLNPGAVECPF